MKTSSMDELFGPSGLFARRFSGFEYRQQQVELAEQVQATLSDAPGRILAAEAPPGVGKTFALLAPAMLWAAERNKTILVLTGGI
ncbi:MAG TPA: ATP-dependent DNA helicase, partial [Synergistaceae bacterium]|nr:ATP-dependent DNA helicase [Synergistaceae bacterium]